MYDPRDACHDERDKGVDELVFLEAPCLPVFPDDPYVAVDDGRREEDEKEMVKRPRYHGEGRTDSSDIPDKGRAERQGQEDRGAEIKYPQFQPLPFYPGYIDQIKDKKKESRRNEHGADIYGPGEKEGLLV